MVALTVYCCLLQGSGARCERTENKRETFFSKKKDDLEKQGWKLDVLPSGRQDEKVDMYELDGAAVKLGQKARARYRWIIIVSKENVKKGMDVHLDAYLWFPKQEVLELKSDQGNKTLRSFPEPVRVAKKGETGNQIASRRSTKRYLVVVVRPLRWTSDLEFTGPRKEICHASRSTFFSR